MYGIRLEGDTRKLMKKLRHYSDIDKKAANRTIGEAVRESTLERFKQGIDPEGKKWEPSQRAIAEGGQTLVDSARLRNSIRSQADSTGFAVGTNVIYASSQQLGVSDRKVTIRAKTPKGLRFQVGGKWIRKKEVKVTINVPKREFLGLSKDDQREIQDILNETMEQD